MEINPLMRLHGFGQSIWLDGLQRGMLDSGELQRLIDEDGLSGATSNLSSFETAIAGGQDYDDAFQALALGEKSVHEIYQTLTIEDVGRAADVLYPIYENTGRRDGFVSLAISPHLAHHTNSTISRARELWDSLDRPNVMIKVPATREGLPAIQQLISEGINVNVTLLFGLLRYREAADAYLRGMMARAARGKSLEAVTSVASFFLSRIDVLADPMLEQLMRAGGPNAEIAKGIHGQVAIASAKVAYQMYDDIFDGERFRQLAAQGASPQRLLWASTHTQNPEYSDVKYVEALIGPETVIALTPETLGAYRDHGDPLPRLEESGQEALQVLHHLAGLEIDLGKATQRLEDGGVRELIKSFDGLMEALKMKRIAGLGGALGDQSFNSDDHLAAAQQQFADLEEE
jgi:transaldolase